MQALPIVFAFRDGKDNLCQECHKLCCLSTNPTVIVM